MGQLNFVKGTTSAGTDDICQSVFEDIGHDGPQSFDGGQITRLDIVLTRSRHCVDNFGFHLIVDVEDAELDDFGNLGFQQAFTTVRLANMVGISLQGPCSDCSTTDSDFIATY